MEARSSDKEKSLQNTPDTAASIAEDADSDCDLLAEEIAELEKARNAEAQLKDQKDAQQPEVAFDEDAVVVPLDTPAEEYDSCLVHLLKKIHAYLDHRRHTLAPIESAIGRFAAGSAALAIGGAGYYVAGGCGLAFAAGDYYVERIHITERIYRERENRPFAPDEKDVSQTIFSNFGKSLAVIASSLGAVLGAGLKAYLETDIFALAVISGALAYFTRTFTSGQSCFEISGQNVQQSLAGKIAQCIVLDFSLITNYVVDLPQLLALSIPAYDAILQLFSNNVCLKLLGVTNPVIRLPAAFVVGLPLAASQYDLKAGLEQHIFKRFGEREHANYSPAALINYGAEKFMWITDRVLTGTTDVLQCFGISPQAQIFRFNIVGGAVKGITIGVNATQKLVPVTVPITISGPSCAVLYSAAVASNAEAAKTLGLETRIQERYKRGKKQVDDHASAKALPNLGLMSNAGATPPTLAVSPELKGQSEFKKQP